jgi:glycerol uptake operon antiterminator
VLTDKIIVAIRNEEDLNAALKMGKKTVFLLFGDICSLEETTRMLKATKKEIFVHIDMIAGLDSRENIAINFLNENSYVDGVISTKPSVIKYAKRIGLKTIQRCFLLDSLSLENSLKLLSGGDADAVEILPGVMPKIIRRLTKEIKIPLIAGGLISDEEDIKIALEAGAQAVSTTKKELWRE